MELGEERTQELFQIKSIQYMKQNIMIQLTTPKHNVIH